MKKAKNKKWVKYVVVVLVILALFAVRLQRNYYYYVLEYSNLMYSPVSAGNPNLVTAGAVNKVDKDSNRLSLEVKPGVRMDTQIYVRNGEDVTNSIHVKIVKQDCGEEGCGDKVMIDPSWFKISGLDDNGNVALAPNEVRFFDVSVLVPAGTGLQQYSGVLSVNSNTSTLIETEPGVQFNVVTANTSPLDLVVTDSPKVLDYSVVLDDPRDLAINTLLLDARKYASILLGLIALYCIYLAYKKNK